MARLRIYTVHINPALPQPYEQPEFVAEGFSWKAFVFAGLWALYHRLWWQALGIFFYYFLIFNLYSSDAISHFGVSAIDFGVRLIIGFESGEWLRERLKRRGYVIADIATGDSLLRAEQRFFDRYFALHPGAAV